MYTERQKKLTKKRYSRNACIYVHVTSVTFVDRDVVYLGYGQIIVYQIIVIIIIMNLLIFRI